MRHLYYCSACRLAVVLIDGKELVRACACNAPVIAEACASLAGAARMAAK